MTLVEKVKNLCNAHQLTFAALERRLDFGNGTIRKWDRATPSGDKLAKVADFFDVSVDYLLDRSEKEPSPENRDGELNDIYFSFAKDAQDNGIDPEDIKAILKIMKRSKESNANGDS